MNIAAMRVRVTFEKYGHHRQIRKPQNRLGGLFLLLGDCRHKLRFRIFRCSHQSGGIAGLHLPLLL